MMTAFAPFQQVAYVVGDIDQAMALFARDYGVPTFHLTDVTLTAQIRGVAGTLDIRTALANLDGVQIELIEPCGGMDALYAEAIAGRPAPAVQFHHIAAIDIERTAWERRRDWLRTTDKVVLDGGTPGQVEYIYIDERQVLGHHVEYIWYAPEVLRYLDEVVPRFSTM